MTAQGSNVILVYKMDPMYISFLSGKVSVFVVVDYPAFPQQHVISEGRPKRSPCVSGSYSLDCILPILKTPSDSRFGDYKPALLT